MESELNLKMHNAFETGNLVDALSHLEPLVNSSSPGDLHRHKSLSNYTLLDLPIIHYLARFPYREKDLPHLDKLIKILTEAGYNINKTTNNYSARKRASLGFTALLAAIEQQNPIFVECLLRHGARPDIRDQRGFSPYHWAVIVGDLKCLEKVIDFGGYPMVSTSMEKSGEGEVHPLLHTAVDEGRTEIVYHLLTKEEYGVNVNEEAIYRGVLSEEVFIRFPSRYNNDSSKLKTVDMPFTPLGRAARMRKIPIIEVLLKQPDVKLSGFSELHFCLVEGDSEVAHILLEYFSDEQLATDKIQDLWALHCLHPRAFQEEDRIPFTKAVILEYVDGGWDVNSFSSSSVDREITLLDKSQVRVSLTKFTLLHLACLYRGHEIIKTLVEETQVDMNCKTEGQVELTPLQILLTLEQWESASYLIEKGADLNLKGSFKNLPFSIFGRINLTTGVLEKNAPLNAIELLVRMGCKEGLPVLDQVLENANVIWEGASEFHLAVEGSNPVYISKVVQRCAKLISLKNLTWMTWSIKDPHEVPSLLWLLNTLKLKEGLRLDEDFIQALADLINLLVTLGYNLNTFWKDHPTFVLPEQEPLLFHILAIDFAHKTSNLLLRTVLQTGHLQLNGFSQNPVDYLLGKWNGHCSSNQFSSKCWKCDDLLPPSVEAVKLLVTHGVDVSGMVIGPQFKYHNGYNVVLKLLYCAGATISEEFFTTSPVCHKGYLGTKGFDQEIVQVKKWKDEFDQENGLRLKHLSRLRIRKMLKCVDDLKMLEELPGNLKNYILGNVYI